MKNFLKKLGKKLFELIERYDVCFLTKTGNCSKKAGEYLRGLIQSSRGNMSAMAEVIPDTDNQSLQHFINNSPFNEEKLKRQINEDVNNKLKITFSFSVNFIFFKL